MSRRPALAPPGPRPRVRAGARAWLAAAIVLAVMALMVGGAIAIIGYLRRPIDALEAKVTSADRYLYYRVSAQRGPHFSLSGTVTLRVISHVILPGGATYDPRREVRYGLRLRARNDGKTLWQQDLFTKSRQSKARPFHGDWLDETAFSLEPGVELTDDRTMYLVLPPNTPRGAVLEITLLGEFADGLVRVYEERARGDLSRALRISQAAAAPDEGLTERVTFLPWSQLSKQEQSARLRINPTRLSAVGEEGTDYRLLAVLTTGFRLPFVEAEAAPPVAISRQHSAAFNLQGPGTIDVRLRRAFIGGSVANGEVELTTLTGDGEQAQVKVALAAAGAATPTTPPPTAVTLPARELGLTVHRLALADQATTLTLATESATPISVEIVAVDGAPSALGLRDSSAPLDLLPDEVVLPLWRTGPETPPLELALFDNETSTRLTRIDVRLTATTLALLSPQAATELTVEALDAKGQALQRSTVPVAAEPSRFERIAQALLPSVSEPVTVYFAAPPGAARLRVQTREPAAVRFLVPTGSAEATDVLQPPYEGLDEGPVHWRYAPRRQRSWGVVRPEPPASPPAAASTGQGDPRAVQLVAQVRFDSDTPGGVRRGDARSLQPIGAKEAQALLEPVTAADAAEVLQAWPPGSQTMLRPGATTTIDFGRGGPGRPRLRYWLLGDPESLLGQDLTVAVDGVSVLSTPVLASSGSLELPATLRRAGEVVVMLGSATGKDVRLLVDRPPGRPPGRPPARGQGAAMVSTRTVYRLSSTVRVKVPRQGGANGGEPTVLNAVIYAEPAQVQGLTLRATIDGGKPKRSEGQAHFDFTAPSRVLVVPPSLRPPALGLVDVRGGRALSPYRVSLRLGTDLTPGEHLVELQASRPLRGWVRFFVLQPEPRGESAISVRRRTVELEGDP
jgi:hypothetical protein